MQLAPVFSGRAESDFILVEGINALCQHEK